MASEDKFLRKSKNFFVCSEVASKEFVLQVSCDFVPLVKRLGIKKSRDIGLNP